MGTNIAGYRKFLFRCILPAVWLLAVVAAPAGGAEMKTMKVQKVTEELALRHPLMLKVTNLQEWLGQEGNDFSRLVLYIDGMAFRGLTPALMEGDTLLYDLQRNDENKEAWTAVLSRKRGNFFFSYVPVSLGFENGVQLPSEAKLRFIRINPKGFRVFGSICLVTIVLFFVLAWRSDIIRDTGPQPEGVDSYGKPYRKTYSLARTQMAFWFFTIIIGYVFIWMVTSDFSSLTPGVIGLMGISAVTGVGAAVVDSSKRSEQQNQRRLFDEKKKRSEVEAEKLISEISALEAAVAAAPGVLKAEEQRALLAAKQAALAANQKEIAQARKKIGEIDTAEKSGVSQGFLKDILSDDDGVSFHRFQISVWTIVLIIIFLGRVYDTLGMPTVDSALLAVMGISNVTYIGFKLPDQQG
ncbi:MAG: hypothetical protein HY789_11390 [Deltaproteobacteria bacterium]|nr:hypothetical protein [Deltaproteobacteria bacterium]